MQIKSSFILLLTPILLGCTSAKEPEEFLRYCYHEENGLVKKRESNSIQTKVLYRPSKVLAAERNIKGLSNEGESNVDQSTFNFQISIPSGSILRFNENSENNRNTRHQYFSFDVKNDLFIEQDGNKIQCLGVILAPNYDLKPTLDMVVNFPLINEEEDFTFNYRDRQYGLGLLKYTFKSNDITNIPELKK